MPKKIFGKTARDALYNGVHGNLSAAVLEANLSALATGDVVVLGEFDTPITIVGWRLVHGSLGAGAELNLGIESDGDVENDYEAIADSLNVATAGIKEDAGETLRTGSDFRRIALEVVGGTPTGEVKLIIEYINQG